MQRPVTGSHELEFPHWHGLLHKLPWVASAQEWVQNRPVQPSRHRQLGSEWSQVAPFSHMSQKDAEQRGSGVGSEQATSHMLPTNAMGHKQTPGCTERRKIK